MSCLLASVTTLGAGEPRRGGDVDLGSVAIQVALDRAGFSPGEIDGRSGKNTRKAEAVHEVARGELDVPEEPLRDYEVTAADCEGPFLESLPEHLRDQASLPGLHYTSVLELIAERFHASPGLLRALNPGSSFAAGERILVPDVVEVDVPSGAAPRTDGPGPVIVTVSARTRSLTVEDREGNVLMFAPATAGSSRDPLPRGSWRVKGIIPEPSFAYDPALFWDAPEGDAKARIAPGPNNPVGSVWIDIDRDHYGIHGTPEPGKVGRAESHGCVRLTNWDALRLSRLVEVGTQVVFE